MIEEKKKKDQTRGDFQVKKQVEQWSRIRGLH